MYICVSVYLCMCVPVRVCLCVYLYMCVHVSVCMCLCVCVCMCLCMCVCLSVCRYICVCLCMFMSVCLHMLLCVYVCVCIYSLIYVYVEARGRLWVSSSIAFYPYFWNRVSHWTQSWPIQSDWSGSPEDPRSFESLAWGLLRSNITSHFSVGTGDLAWVLVLQQQAFYWISYLSAFLAF